MKALPLLLLVLTVGLSFTSCRSRGGPARAGDVMDRAAYKTGQGISHAGHVILRAAN